jgi:2-C-methyl-D-erythritol 4-phosphate cytidylyltransferase
LSDTGSFHKGAAVVLVAAGSGTRFGSRKQFVELLPGVSILDRSYEVARSVSSNVIVVVPPDTVRSISARYPLATVVAGGSTRTESVRFEKIENYEKKKKRKRKKNRKMRHKIYKGKNKRIKKQDKEI